MPKQKLLVGEKELLDLFKETEKLKFITQDPLLSYLLQKIIFLDAQSKALLDILIAVPDHLQSARAREKYFGFLQSHLSGCINESISSLHPE